MASSSAIISPWGEVFMDDSLEELEHDLDLKEIKKSHRMINMN
jgi:predicted amidohydrolase